MNRGRKIQLNALLVCGLFSVSVEAGTADGIILEYSFNDSTGNAVLDSSASGIHSYIENTVDYTGPTWDEGVAGTALRFDGANDLLNVGDYDILDVGRYTLSAWINFKDIAQPDTIQATATRLTRSSHEILEKIGAYWMNIRLGEQSVLRSGGRFGECGKNTKVTVDSNIEIHENVWTHVATTYNGRKLKVYVNGKVGGKTRVKGGKCNSDHPLVIGAKYTSLPFKDWSNGVINNNFSGKIDNVRIYIRALSKKEIKSLAKISPEY